eukprot:jgi/Mesen1/2854/ME000174S02119
MGSLFALIWQLPPPVLVGSIVGTLLVIWLASYVLDWLHQLEAGSRVVGVEAYLEDPTSLKKVAFPSVFAPAEKYLTLIFPAFNEEDRLPVNLDETFAYLQQREKLDKSFTYEILVVDDGSTDRTVSVAFEYVKRHGLDKMRVIKLGVNRGKGACIRKGMLCSRGELLLFADADGATKITDVEKLEAEAKIAVARATAKQRPPGGAKAAIGDVPAAVFGSRAHLEKQALSSVGLFVPYSCGFKMFTRSAARQLFPNQRLNRWCFDVELVYLCKRLGIPMAEVSVTWTEIAGSKVRVSSVVHMLLELALVRLGYGFRLWRIHRSFVQN